MNDAGEGRPRPRGSFADQDEAQLGGPASVLVRQKRDHVRLDRLLHQLADSSGATQQRLLIRIQRLVFPHAFAEEDTLLPGLQEKLSVPLAALDNLRDLCDVAGSRSPRPAATGADDDQSDLGPDGPPGRATRHPAPW